MSVASEIERIKGNIASAYTAASGKGATMPDVQNSANLAGCIDTITGGGGSASKYGVTIDNILGDASETLGGYTRPTEPFTVNMTGVKIISSHLTFRFANLPVERLLFPDAIRIGSTSSGIGATGGACAYLCYAASTSLAELAEISFPNLEEVAGYGFAYAFYNQSMKSAVFPKLITAGNYSFNNAFYGTQLESAEFPALETIGTSAFANGFYNSKYLAYVSFPSLVSLGQLAFNYCFYKCALTAISFPMLTTVATNSFGSSTSSLAFSGCSGLTEIHFRADMQATIEAMTGYSSKFGATSSTIYFDL